MMATFLFHLDLFDQVAALVQPRRRRRLTEEQRRHLAEQLARVRPKALRQSDFSGQGATIGSKAELLSRLPEIGPQEAVLTQPGSQEKA
ncbi:MAG: hypothetical protein HYS12_23525 [Planctomycetes bacterium]|nr:hypothetical protein [Planctomycetota bacterium]